MSRFTAATGLVLLVTTALVGCTPAAEPEPEWTEESAYAAAEETFRAFNHAVYDDEEGTLEYVTGEMVTLEQEAEEKARTAGLVIRGNASILSFEASSFRRVGHEVVVMAAACVDASRIEVRTEAEDWRQPREKPVYGVRLTFTSADSKMLIDDYYDSEEVSC